MLNGVVEIIGGRERRRRWGLEEKLRRIPELIGRAIMASDARGSRPAP